MGATKGMTANATTATGSPTFARKRASKRSRFETAITRITTPTMPVAATRWMAPTYSVAERNAPEKLDSKPAMAMITMSFHGMG